MEYQEEREGFLRAARSRFPTGSEAVERALRFAEEAHKTQRRRTGEPYVTHLLAVAGLVAAADHPAVDAETLMAALLHDVVEDTPRTLADVEREFGSGVARIVDALTDRKEAAGRRDRDRLYHEQLLLAAERDARVVLIKCADILHNSETITTAFSPERRRERAESMELLFAPQAERLGLGSWADRMRANARRGRQSVP